MLEVVPGVLLYKTIQARGITPLVELFLSLVASGLRVILHSIKGLFGGLFRANLYLEGFNAASLSANICTAL